METAAQLPAEFDFPAQAARFYAKLIAPAAKESAGDPPPPAPDEEPTLGGLLLYAGELDQQGRALVVASNIAGAASLAATGDSAAQKLAIRDSTVDFLVNSLDEALRILKNEIRKRQPVAVCVALPPNEIEREMSERGVLPDLHRSTLAAPASSSAASKSDRDEVLIAWSVPSSPAIWMPKLDAIALDCLHPSAWPQRRWLRLSPRYLGRLARSARLLQSDSGFAGRFVSQLKQQFELAQIGAAVEIHISAPGTCDHYRFAPRAD